MSVPIELSTSANHMPLQVSKSRKIPFLITTDEWRLLFEALEPCVLYSVGRPISQDAAQIKKQAFLSAWDRYIEGIKQKKLVDEKELAPYFSAILVCKEDLVYAQSLGNGKYLIRPKVPSVQIQRHHLLYSDKLYSGVMGEGSITWGVTASYPQLFLDSNNAIGKVDKTPKFPNTQMFLNLTRWIRSNTLPTPIQTSKGERKNYPFRLGKEAFSWINHHPQLKKKELSIGCYKGS